MTDPRKNNIHQWLTVAENDFQAYSILASESTPPTIAVVFHCQQYVEKLLKAVLTLNGEEITKTHDIRNLILAAMQYVPDLKSVVDEASELTIYGVETRYPGAIAISQDEMKEAVEIATKTGKLIKNYLDEHFK
jgi:HEPN domain-containing protein